VNSGFESGSLGDAFTIAIFPPSSGTSAHPTVENNPSAAQQGNYFLLVSRGSDPLSIIFKLSQQLTGLCHGAPYRLTFWSRSTPAAGDNDCKVRYCLGGDTCQVADPGLDNWIRQTLDFTPAPGQTMVTLSVDTRNTTTGGTTCLRDSVSLDSFQLVAL